jgi:hypothetical protein
VVAILERSMNRCASRLCGSRKDLECQQKWAQIGPHVDTFFRTVCFIISIEYTPDVLESQSTTPQPMNPFLRLSTGSLLGEGRFNIDL